MSKIKRPKQSRGARFHALPDVTNTTRQQSAATRDEGRSSSDTRQLIFFYDCEATGLNVYKEHITEIAAKVYVADAIQPSVNRVIFSSLVRTTRFIPERVRELTGITEALLRDKKLFSVIFSEFLDWISTTTKEVSEASNAPHTPVLVAHNGYQYDFPILLAEIERSDKPELTNWLITHNIWFADTLHYLKQARDGGLLPSSVKKLDLKTLHFEFLKKDYEAHRALPDVEAMEELFTNTALADLLPIHSIPTRSAEEQLKHWQDQKEKYSRTEDIRKALGPQNITYPQAQRLVELSLSYDILCRIRKDTVTREKFKEDLKKRGVRSSPLQDMLAKLIAAPLLVHED